MFLIIELVDFIYVKHIIIQVELNLNNLTVCLANSNITHTHTHTSIIYIFKIHTTRSELKFMGEKV